MKYEEFKNPSQLYKPAPFWSWNDKLDKEELERQIDELHQKGFGGYFIHSRVGLVTGYLSDEWMELIRFCVKKSKVTNASVWLYDEDKWPSGFAGGEVSQNKAFRSRALVLLRESEQTNDDIPLKRCEYDNETYLICKRISPLGNVWFNGASYVDLMNPEAVKEFIRCTHERYKSACGEYFGREIPGIFTDEPCYLMEKFYDVPVLPWSEYLPEYFFKLKGYEITDFLPELFFNLNDFRKIRFDFFDAATRLFTESFTKQYFNWCENNQLKMTGHFMAEDGLDYQTRWIGAAMPHYEFMHWPGIDKLGRTIEQVTTVKQLTSVADQLGKERSLSELYCGIGQQTSFYHRKWIADWQAALGINFFNYHLSLYSMRGERKRDYPPNLFYQQPWWEDEVEFSNYIARLSLSMSQGIRDVDILVIHPIASIWSDYSPMIKDNSKPFIYDSGDFLNVLSKTLTANKLDYHYGDETILENHARVENGRLVVGQYAYSTVIIPQCITLRSRTIDLLMKFSEETESGQIIIIKPYPDRIDGVLTEISWPSNAVALISLEEVLSFLNEHYPERLQIIDKLTRKNAAKVICHARNVGSEKYVFLTNTDEIRETKATISIPGLFTPYVMDLFSGNYLTVPYKTIKGRTIIEMEFYPTGSILLYLSNHKFDFTPVPAFLDTGIRFDAEFSKLKMINSFSKRMLDQNVLPINNVTLYLDDRLIAYNQPVVKVLHDYFYQADEGTSFKAEYCFNVSTVPDGDIYAVIEVAENCDQISLNGHEVFPMKARGEMGAFNANSSWLDVNFTKVKLTGFLEAGNNMLILSGRKSNNITGPATHVAVSDFQNHMPTEVETVYIIGDFSVIDDCESHFQIISSYPADSNWNLTDAGYPFYAGKVQFSTTLSIDKIDGGRVYLQVNGVEAACIKLLINGKRAGLRLWEPFIFDITDLITAKENDVSIIASSTMFNLMGPNFISGIGSEVFVRAGTFVESERYTQKYTFVPFGIKSISLLEQKNNN